jgi:hypothetical protein
MEDLKQIQEFFSKPLNENVYVEAFKLEKALKGMGHDVKVKYLDDFGKDVFEIYSKKPLDDDSIFYDAEKLGYSNVRVFDHSNESVDEASKEEETEFHTKLDKLVHDTFGKRKGEMEESVNEMDMNDPVMMKMRAAKDKLAKMRAANAGDDGNDKFFDAAKLRALKKKRAQIMRDMEQEAEMEGGPVADKYGDMLNKIDKAIAMLSEYNTGLYYDPSKEKYAVKAKQASKSGLEKVRDFVKKVMKEEEITIDDATEFKINLKHLLDKHVVKGEALSDFEEEDVNYDELYSDYKYKVNEAKPKKGHGEKISKEVFAKLKGKTISYKGADYKVVDSDEAVLTLKDEDGKSKTINLRQFNVSGMIDEIMETIELGKNLNEELCAKGKAYIKKRQAAGEKSSAYLSGRAVKVCKGQMKG